MQDYLHTAIRKPGTRPSEIERIIFDALSTYANVDRGTGHFPRATEKLVERAREVILRYMGLDNRRYCVVFCSPIRCEQILSRFRDHGCSHLSSQQFKLPFGLRAIAIEKSARNRVKPDQSGGGTVKMVGTRSVVWANPPQLFEAGTPNIIGSIALAGLVANKLAGRDPLPEPRRNSDVTVENILYQDTLAHSSGGELLRKLQKVCIGKNLRLPLVEGAKEYIHLDNAATTPTFTPVYNAACKALRMNKSLHGDLIKEVKELCAELLGAPTDRYEMVFTANATEAINIASELFLHEDMDSQQSVIVNSMMEHNSNELPWRKAGRRPLRLPLDQEGLPCQDCLERWLREYNELHKHGRKRIRVVSITGISNILGFSNNLKVFSAVSHKYGAFTVVDGAQWLAHRKIHLEDSGIDCFVFSGHKMYAPFGTGVLVIRKNILNIQKEQLERFKASGEENIIGIAALGKAINLLLRAGFNNIESHEKLLLAKCMDGLKKIPGLKIYGPDDPQHNGFSRKTSLVSFTVKTVPHNLLARKMAEYGGIGIRTGCLCAHILVKHLLTINRFRSLTAMVLSRLIPEHINPVLPGLVRISFGIENTNKDVEAFLSMLDRIVKEPLPWWDRIFASMYSGSPTHTGPKALKAMEKFASSRADMILGPQKIE